MSDKIDLGAFRKRAEQDGAITSGAFKLVNGANILRVVDGFLAHEGVYNGKRNFKWLTRVIDDRDGQIKTFFMSHVIFKMLEDFQKEEGYEFDSLPMPYKVNIKAENAGTINAKYNVIASPKRTEMTPEQTVALDALKQKDPLEKVQQAIFEKNGGAAVMSAPPTPDFDPDEIPF